MFNIKVKGIYDDKSLRGYEVTSLSLDWLQEGLFGRVSNAEGVVGIIKRIPKFDELQVSPEGVHNPDWGTIQVAVNVHNDLAWVERYCLAKFSDI